MEFDWQAFQETKREMELQIDRMRGAGFPSGAWLPVQVMDAHHEAIQHIREIEHLMQRMYNRGLEEEWRRNAPTAETTASGK